MPAQTNTPTAQPITTATPTDIATNAELRVHGAATATRVPRTCARLALIALGLLLACALFEGTYSIATGRSLLRGDRMLAFQLSLTDDDRARLALTTPGPYSTSIDPGIAYTLKPNTVVEFHGVPSSTDARGSRLRIGPPPTLGSPHIVLLGDSVTYGFGVRDDATLASRLEAVLAAGVEDGAPRPVVTTLAVPGWNVRNACRAMRDHLASLAPDVVIFTPVSNDLYDSFTVTEAGHRSLGFDPEFGATRPHVSYESFFALLTPMATRMSIADALAFRAAGGLASTTPAAITRVSPESIERWHHLHADLHELRRTLALHPCKLAIHPWFDGDFERILAQRLLSATPAFEIIAPLLAMTPTDLLAGDPHPNPTCIAARAACIAHWLAERGWVNGLTASRLRPVPAGYSERWPALPAPALLEQQCSAIVERWRAQFGHEIDLTRARGFHQLYGGVAADGTVGPSFFGALRVAPGRRLRFEIERLAPSSGVYPLSLHVSTSAGAGVGVDIPAPEPGVAVGDDQLNHTFELPFDFTLADPTRVIDVRVEASNWVMERPTDTTRLAAFRLRRVGFGVD